VIILDTNVLSAVMQRKPSERVIAWLNRQPATSVWTTAVTVFEIEYGLRRLPKGKRRTKLVEAFQAVMTEELGGRILAFDVSAARAAGALSATQEAEGNSIEVRDVQIAGIASVRQATVATRNVKHFERACAVVNPWERTDH
jgi:predicted nucleic acid-binding protein